MCNPQYVNVDLTIFVVDLPEVGICLTPIGQAVAQSPAINENFVINLSLGPRELKYVLKALKCFEDKLIDESGEDMEDAGNDLLIVQAIAEKIRGASADQASSSNQ